MLNLSLQVCLSTFPIILLTMKHLILLFLTLTLVFSQTPNCKVRADRSLEKVFIYPNETQAYSFGDFFTGFNLLYHANGTETTYKVVQNIYETSKIPIDTIPDNYGLIDFDIYSDGNGAWMNRASSLGKANDGYYLRYGYMTEQLNVNITNTVPLNTTGVSLCYDVATVTDRSIMVDCFNADTSKDIFYLFDEIAEKASGFPFDNDLVTDKRKTIPYHITGNRTYLLSATLASGVRDQSKVNQTYVRIYLLDLTNNITKVGQVDASTFQLDGLAITDITVDALENIYVTDAYGTLLQFSFDGTQPVFGGKWNFETGLYKVSVYIAPDLVQTIQVLSENSIIEIDLDNEKKEYNYELPVGAGKNAIDFQTNERLLIVATNEKYYIYERYRTNINEMLALYDRSATLFALSPRSPHIIILGLNSTRSLVSSEGFLLINNALNKNQTIRISAASQNPDGENPVCVVEFLVTSITTDNKIWVKKDFNMTAAAENPAYELYRLDQYFVGSRLSYEPQPGKGTTLNLQYISNINITTNTDALGSLNWFATYSYDVASYYRLYQKDNQMNIQNCVYDSENINCKTTRSFPFSDKILFSAFFQTTIDLKSNIPFFVYANQSNPHYINIIQIDSDKAYPSLLVNEQFNITDIDANERFIYATVKGAHVVYVFKNDLKTYDVDFIIDESFIKIDHPVFYPKETILSPEDINVLVILNLNSLIILRITAFSHEYITSIYLPQLEISSAQCKVQVSKQTLLIFISDDGKADQILEYGIYDIYNPVFLRTITLGDKSLARNLSVFGINEGNVVAARTKDLNGEIYLTLIRAGQPKAGSVLTDVHIGNATFASLVSLSDSAVLQIYVDANEPPTSSYLRTHTNYQDSTYVTQRYYFRPLLIVRAHLDQGFKSNFSFGLIVTSTNDSLQVVKSITVYNVKSKIEPSPVQHEVVALPDKSNSDQPTIRQIQPDPLFIGPVAKYEIKCPACGDKIQLLDHVKPLGTSDALVNVKAYYFFEDKNRLWALTDSKIHVTDGSLAYVSSIGFDFANSSITAKNWYVDGNNNVQVLFTNDTDENQFFVELTPSEDRGGATIKTPIQIQNNPGAKNVQLIKSSGNKIFVQEARLDDVTNSKVHAYAISTLGGVKTITYQTTIDFSTFGQIQDNGVNDFEIYAGTANQAHFIATLGSVGLAWFSFDNSVEGFSALNPGVYNLTTNPEIFNNLIDESNNYLQIETRSMEWNGNTLKIQSLLTVDNGQHFQLNIQFNYADNTLSFSSLNVITTFGKYGKQRVLNWAQSVSFKDHGQNIFLIAHQGHNNNVISLSLYDLQYSSSSNVQQMMGAITYSANKALTSNLAAWLFRTGNDLRAVQSVNDDSYANAQLYNLSKQVYISYKYDEIKQDFSNIDIVASNNYGSATKQIPVKIDRPDNTSGLAWYFILIIALGAVLVVGLVVFIVIKQKRKRSGKDSLLSTSKNESDEEV